MLIKPFFEEEKVKVIYFCDYLGYATNAAD